MTTIRTYDPKDGPALPELTPLPLGVLAVGTADLLQQAADLPQPIYITICDTQHIGVQFEAEQPSLKAVTRWALRFGGIITTVPHQGKDGPETWCSTQFSYYGLAVTAYAHIPAVPASI